MENFDVYLTPHSNFCFTFHFIHQWAKFCFYIDFSLCQIDKFLALYLNAAYKGMVSTKLCFIIVFVTKSVMMMLTCLVSATFDPFLLQCSRHSLHVCRYFR